MVWNQQYKFTTLRFGLFHCWVSGALHTHLLRSSDSVLWLFEQDLYVCSRKLAKSGTSDRYNDSIKTKETTSYHKGKHNRRSDGS